MRPQLRTIAPVPEVEYFLDCAQEATELDACSAMTLRLYGDDRELLPIATQRFHSFKERLRHNLQLAEEADIILAWLPPERRAGLIHLGLRGIVYEIEQMAEVFACWAMEDEIEGGCLLPFRERQRQKKGVTFKRTLRRLYSPKFIRRYVRRNRDEADHLKKLADIVIGRAIMLGEPALSDRTINEAYRAQINNRAKIRATAQEYEQWKARKMILRSWRQAMSIVGRETVSAFLRGEEVRLIGAESILAIRKRGALHDVGHGCLSVALLTRDGASLADLCTYIENTPTLDQLSAFALWMKAGEDRSIIKSANIIRIEDGVSSHPLLQREPRQSYQERLAVIGARLTQELGQEQATRILEMLNDNPNRRVRFVRQLTYEETRHRNQEYWQRTKGHWMEAMVVAIIGYQNLPLFKVSGTL